MSRPQLLDALPIPSGLALLKTLFGSIGLFCGLYSFFLLGPDIETRYRPVLSKLTITEVRELTPDTSLVRAEFTKLRGCEYMGIAWYRGSEANDFERISMTPVKDPEDTSSPNRPVGTQRAGPWRLTMPAGEVRQNSFVQVFHRCHPFWTTMTRFYP
ncbi:hypothetical protein [Neorhizobium alkalisoli]|uniref:Uncharacterized protein n=1 Tax=Neorhizobium alkalisoli TaxID=528178 RepID=A0A561QSC6_9HYPH|nr:hypothetical protein [Neorhizobium alkalisoli]TWF53281.1 hypothetical protein FHW37_104558 [Neorhizobium alkalisoli]